MDSEHLNVWLKRGEIQEVAERFKEYKDMLKRMSPDQIQKLRDKSRAGQEKSQEQLEAVEDYSESKRAASHKASNTSISTRQYRAN